MKKEFFENKIEGFSKISKKEKIEWIESNYFKNKSTSILEKYWNKDKALQKIHDEFTENTISNFHPPPPAPRHHLSLSLKHATPTQ